MIRRPRRTVPATIVGLVLLAAAVVVAVSCIQVIVGGRPLVPFSALGALGRDTTWDAPGSLAAGAVLVLAGLVLLLCGLHPGRPQVLALARGDDDIATGILRRSLEGDLARRVRGVDGITAARVTVGARAVSVHARTPLRERSGLPERIRERITERLDAIDLAHPVRLRVAITADRNAR
jgi:hypothetical protein